MTRTGAVFLIVSRFCFGVGSSCSVWINYWSSGFPNFCKLLFFYFCHHAFDRYAFVVSFFFFYYTIGQNPPKFCVLTTKALFVLSMLRYFPAASIHQLGVEYFFFGWSSGRFFRCVIMCDVFIYICSMMLYCAEAQSASVFWRFGLEFWTFLNWIVDLCSTCMIETWKLFQIYETGHLPSSLP